MPVETRARSLVVVTYNVHGCVGLDGRTDVARVAAVLQELSPDVIALQEVLAGFGDDPDGQVGELARLLDMEAVFGTTLRRRAGRYGNAILSRIPIVEWGFDDISVRGCEPRCIMRARLGGGVTVLNTHLGLRARERHRQIAWVEDFLDGRPTAPVVLMGDFNAWMPRGDVLGRLRARFGAPPAPRSFPVRRPLLALDRIWTLPFGILREVRAHASLRARIASDHLPVWGRLSD
jgi:endonuclease/exonuclease/phosphatase family metal-dependent hydrolase